MYIHACIHAYVCIIHTYVHNIWIHISEVQGERAATHPHTHTHTHTVREFFSGLVIFIMRLLQKKRKRLVFVGS